MRQRAVHTLGCSAHSAGWLWSAASTACGMPACFAYSRTHPCTIPQVGLAEIDEYLGGVLDFVGEVSEGMMCSGVVACPTEWVCLQGA